MIRNLFKDHPRLRGEYATRKNMIIVLRGSPPPTRGIRLVVKFVKAYIRITPAYAGNTDRSITAVLKSEDHPRLRGEYLYIKD